MYGNEASLPKCHVGHLCDDNAYLCMPYISPLPPRLWPIMADPIFGCQDLEKALGKFVQVGLKQGSMRWSHVGFFPMKEEEENNEQGDDDDDEEEEETANFEAMAVYIMGLGRLEDFQDDNEKNTWIQQSIKTLRSAVPPSCVGFDMRSLHREGHFREHIMDCGF